MAQISASSCGQKRQGSGSRKTQTEQATAGWREAGAVEARCQSEKPIHGCIPAPSLAR